jgi:hypothetical protein
LTLRFDKLSVLSLPKEAALSHLRFKRRGLAQPNGSKRNRMESIISKQTAETKLTVKGKTVIDSLKDWIGKLKGRIQYKKKE